MERIYQTRKQTQRIRHGEETEECILMERTRQTSEMNERTETANFLDYKVKSNGRNNAYWLQTDQSRVRLPTASSGIAFAGVAVPAGEEREEYII